MFCSSAAFRAASGELISGMAVCGSLLSAGAEAEVVAEASLTAVLAAVWVVEVGEEQALSRALLKSRAEAKRCRIGKGTGQNGLVGARKHRGWYGVLASGWGVRRGHWQTAFNGINLLTFASDS